MFEFKKYTKIIRYGKDETLGILHDLGTTIVIQEKLDGANASFTVQDGHLAAFSRRMQLDEINDLRGFYGWTQTLDTKLLNPHYIYFGEWLVKHKIDYGKYMNQFYLFDLYDKNEEKYLHFDLVKEEAKRLGIHLVPIFYEGNQLTHDELQSYVGKSQFGEIGEGIVVKNINYTYHGHQIYTKIINEKFSEVKIKKTQSPKKLTKEQLFINQFLTINRTEKMLHKLINEQIIDENNGLEEMGTILRHLNVRLYEDLLEEEKDMLDDSFDHKLLRRAIGKSLPKQIKQIIQKHYQAKI